MCIFVYVCINVLCALRACVFKCMRERVLACVYVSACVSVRVNVYMSAVCIYARMCAHRYMSVRGCACMNVCLYVSVSYPMES